MAQDEHIYAKIRVWFRRDLRMHDHAAFYHALKQGRAVYYAFVFDAEILAQRPAQEVASAPRRLSAGVAWPHARRNSAAGCVCKMGTISSGPNILVPALHSKGDH